MVKQLVTRAKFAKIAGVTPAAVTKAAELSLKNCVDGKYLDANHPDALAYIEKIARAKTPETLPGIDPLYENAVEACRAAGRWSANTICKGVGVGHIRANKILKQIEAAGVPQSDARSDKVMTPTKKEPHVRGPAIVKQRRIAQDTEDLEEIVLPDNIAAFADMTIRDVIRKYGTAERFVDYLKALKEIGIMAEREIKLAEIKGQLISRDLVQKYVVEEFDAAHMKLLRDGSKTLAVQVAAMCAAKETPEDIEKFISEKITDFIRPVKTKISRALRNDRSQ